MSQRNSSQAIATPYFLAGLPRATAIAFCFTLCLAVSLALTIAIIKVYSQDSILGTMYRLAFWLGMEDSWWPMLTALKHIKEGNYAGLYDLIFFTEKIKFQYAVTSLLFIDGLSHLFEPSYANLNIFNFGLMPLIGASLAWVARELGLWQDWRSGVLWMAACGLWTLTFFPVLNALTLGQVQLWIDLLFVLACALWIRDQRFVAGFLIGLVALMKPQMAALLIWALVRGHWTFTRGFLLSTIPLTLLSIYLYGFWNNLEYLGVLQYVAKHGESYYANQSINGLLHRFFGNGPNLEFSDEEFAPYDLRVQITTFVTSAIFIAVGLFARLGARADKLGLDFMVAALAFTIASPVVWDHHYGITPAMFLAALAALWHLHERGAPLRSYMVLYIIAFVLLTTNFFPFGNSWSATPAGTLLQAFEFYGGLALFALLILLRARLVPSPARV